MPSLPLTDPLSLPAEAGFVEQLVRDGSQLSLSILQDPIPRTLAPRLALTTAAGAALFGLAIGLPGGLGQAVASALKLPVVLLGSAALTLPLLHLGTALAGRRIEAARLSPLLLQALATAATTMAALAPVIVVAWLSLSLLSSSDWWVYRRVALFTVAICGVGGLVGAARLLRHLPPTAALPWSAMLGLTGLQLSWLVRPLVGNPAADFVLFRPLESNGLLEVLDALWTVLR